MGLDYSDFGEVSIVAAGTPCQPFSLGSRRRGDRDHRNMFPEVFRALRLLEPPAFLLENVRNVSGQAFVEYFEYILYQLAHPFLAHDDDGAWRSHKEDLERLVVRRDNDPARDGFLVVPAGSPSCRASYAVYACTVNAADYGVPQVRHRMFIIGFRLDLDLDPRLEVFSRPTHSRDALLWAQWGDGMYWRSHDLEQPAIVPVRDAGRVRNLVSHAKRHGPPPLLPWQTIRSAIKGELSLPDGLDPGFQGRLPEPSVPPDRRNPPGDGHYLIPGARVYVGHSGNDLDRPAKTVKAGNHGNPGGEHVLVRRSDDGVILPTGESPRYLSIRECARLQTFPDRYQFPGSRTESMRQLGNAVPVLLARVIAKSLLHRLESRDVCLKDVVGPGADGSRLRMSSAHSLR